MVWLVGVLWAVVGGSNPASAPACEGEVLYNGICLPLQWPPMWGNRSVCLSAKPILQ
jgi:hypothetical protein